MTDQDDTRKTAIIIGAGPAGLCAAYELLKHTDIKPIVIEAIDMVGGISRTINYKGNRLDIGGHRFFSKSDTVMNWWSEILPTEQTDSTDPSVAPTPEQTDKVMLIRNRVSRILYMRKFFDYPLSLSLKTVLNLGLFKTFRIGLSYLFYRLFPIKPERSLEAFFINRFGMTLYKTFFKSYTEKVWGVPCDRIDSSWGAQRIKGLSITKVIKDALMALASTRQSIQQKETETSLIKQFLYPKYGPGQLWEEVARRILHQGGEIRRNFTVDKVTVADDNSFIVNATRTNTHSAKDNSLDNSLSTKGDFLFSSMPVKDLVNALQPQPDEKVREVADGLIYRDFVTVGILLRKMRLKNNTGITTRNNIVPDNWIYIQEEDVKVGRLQIFNNWSPYMVKDEDTVWLGLEYFCNENDDFWNMEESEIRELAVNELVKLDMIERSDVLEATVVKVPKAYPAYFGSYGNFNVIRDYFDRIDGLFLIGRNGMHRYNNMDHSMLTAIEAVQNIRSGIRDKQNIWSINADENYHEEG